jgi:uncharacterized protein YijF (DUF1287 family)
LKALFGLALCAISSFAASAPRSVLKAVADAAAAQTAERVVYDGRYVRIPYPNGDVPAGTARIARRASTCSGWCMKT